MYRDASHDLCTCEMLPMHDHARWHGRNLQVYEQWNDINVKVALMGA